MDKLEHLSEKEIENMCNKIYSKCQHISSTNESMNLTLLRKLCGLRACTCPFFTPSQRLNYLLKVQHHNDSILSLATGVAIITNYDSLGLEDHSNQILERILKQIISKGPSEEIYEFLRRLWGYPGLKNFTITTVEDFIDKQSNFLEEDILDMFEELTKTDKEPTKSLDPKYARIILWCAQSTRIFCVVTSIFNVLLLKTGSLFSNYNKAINVVNQFICKVKLECIAKEKDFVLLYPLEYHSLVSILNINPEYFPESCVVKSSVSISSVVKLVKESLLRNPVQTLCLLTHFPSWIPYVNT